MTLPFKALPRNEWSHRQIRFNVVVSQNTSGPPRCQFTQSSVGVAGKAPWTGTWPDARLLHKQGNTNIEATRTYVRTRSNPWAQCCSARTNCICQSSHHQQPNKWIITQRTMLPSLKITSLKSPESVDTALNFRNPEVLKDKNLWMACIESVHCLDKTVIPSQVGSALSLGGTTD
jgi:hypothetical protein